MNLREYLEKNDIEIKAFAFHNGFSEASVLNWVNEKFIPLAVYQKRIEEITKGLVTKKDWTDAKRRIINHQRSLKKNAMHNTKRVRSGASASPKSSKKK